MIMSKLREDLEMGWMCMFKAKKKILETANDAKVNLGERAHPSIPVKCEQVALLINTSNSCKLIHGSMMNM